MTNKISVTDLIQFLEHVHLNGKVNQVLIEAKDGVLTAGFSTDSRDLIGYVSSQSFPFISNCKFAILDVALLLKMCRIFSKDATWQLNQKDSRVVSMTLYDNENQITYAFGETAIIPKAPELTQLPSMSFRFTITKEISSKIINATGIIDEDMLYIMYDSLMDNIEFIVGDQHSNSNKVVIKFKPQLASDSLPNEEIESIRFSSQFTRDVLYTTKTDKSVKGEVSGEGMLHFCSNDGKLQSNYYLIQQI